MPGSDFADLLRRTRAGDEQTATDLVARYEPVIRTEIRHQLTDPRQRLVSASSICQSVMASSFVQAAAGQYELEHPAQEGGRPPSRSRTRQAPARHRAARWRSKICTVSGSGSA
jgi:hypothetical protein